MTILLRMAIALLVAGVTGLLGFIAVLSVIAWTEHCESQAQTSTLGRVVGVSVGVMFAVIVPLALGGLTWRRLGRFSVARPTGGR